MLSEYEQELFAFLKLQFLPIYLQAGFPELATNLLAHHLFRHPPLLLLLSGKYVHRLNKRRLKSSLVSLPPLSTNYSITQLLMIVNINKGSVRENTIVVNGRVS